MATTALIIGKIFYFIFVEQNQILFLNASHILLSLSVMSKPPPPCLDSKPSAKKQRSGEIGAFFKKESDVHKASCDFVLKHHESTEPVGFKMLRRRGKVASEELNAAIANEDWDTAKVHRDELDKLLQQAEHEDQLYQKSICCRQHAQNRYNLFLKKRDIERLKYYSNVKNASESYIFRVPKDEKIEDVSSGPDTDTDEDGNEDDAVPLAKVVLSSDEDDASMEEVAADLGGAPLPPLPPAIPAMNVFDDEDDLLCDLIRDDPDDIPSGSEDDRKEDIFDPNSLPDSGENKSLRGLFNSTGKCNILKYALISCNAILNSALLYFTFICFSSNQVRCRE